MAAERSMSSNTKGSVVLGSGGGGVRKLAALASMARASALSSSIMEDERSFVVWAW